MIFDTSAGSVSDTDDQNQDDPSASSGSDDQDQNKEQKDSSSRAPAEGSGSSRDISKSKVIVIREILRNIQSNLDQVFKLLGEENLTDLSLLTERSAEAGGAAAAKIIEGVFDGQNMIGPDGKQYTIPANYASKSKLVEGDILKLSISQKGDFIYKQIGPIERSRLIGTLAKNSETGDWFVLVNNKKYKVLSASVTYFKGDIGDEVVILVPADAESSWAAVENIIKKESEGI